MKKRLFYIIFLLIFFAGITNEASTKTLRTSNSLAKFKQSRDDLLKRNIKISKALVTLERLIKQPIPKGLPYMMRLQWIKHNKWMKSVHLRLKNHLLRSKHLSGKTKAKNDNGSGSPLLLNKMAKMNLQFMALLQNIQSESRRYQTISNAITASHQAASASIRNMK